jgi:molecular chaperone HtpG
VRPARRRVSTAIIGSLSVIGALLTTVGVAAGPAQAHGSMSNPPSRIWECFYGDRSSAMCAAAWQANPQALYDWTEVNQPAADGNHQALIPDGKLCSAGRDKYAAFWKDFGAVLKEGIGEDHANQERLAKLLRFASTQADAGVSFADYVKRMKEGQEAIYYITADNLATAKSSPQLEIFRKKGIEVLLLVDRVDEWMLSHLYEFEGHALQSVAKGAFDLGKLQDEAEKKQAEEAAEEFKPVLERLKTALKDRAKDVRVTTRLVESPACIVVDEGDMSGHLARLLKQAGQDAPKSLPTLEVNAAHALVKRLERDERFDDLAQIIFDQALLAEGGQLEDPAAYVQRVNRLLAA